MSPQAESIQEFDLLSEIPAAALPSASAQIKTADASADKSTFANQVTPVLGFLGNVLSHVATSKFMMLLIVCGGFLLVALLWQGLETADLETSPAVAYLMADSDCRFETADLSVGSALAAGPLKLLSGTAQIDMGGGAHLWLEGPSELVLRINDRVYLAEGKLLAHVPGQAVGFTVETASGQIVDLGTEFAVDVAGGETRVAVARGAVDFVPLAVGQADGPMAAANNRPQAPKRLTAGDASCWPPAAPMARSRQNRFRPAQPG